MKMKKVLVLGLSALTLSGIATPVFATTSSTYAIEAQQVEEISYEAVQTENENEYILKANINDERAINKKEITKTLGKGEEVYYIFDNDSILGEHSKCYVEILKNPGLNLRVTLINRDTGATVDSTDFYGTTGDFTFDLDSGIADYKIYIGNKSDKSGQIKFTIKSK